MSINMNICLEYTILFKSEKENVEELLKGVPREIVYKCAAHHIMKQLFNEDQFNVFGSLDYWFSQKNNEYKKEILQLINIHYNGKTENLSLIHPLSNLKIIQYCLNLQPHSDIVLTEDEYEIILFKTYLIINEEITNQFKQTLDFKNEKYSNIGPEVVVFSTAFKMAELFHYNFASEFFCQMVKLSFFYRFVCSKDELKIHHDEFLNLYNVTSINEYAGRFISFIPQITNSNKHGYLEITNNNEDSRLFLEKISNDVIKIEEDHDFKSVRDCPLIKIEEGKYLIAHPLFLINKFFKSIYFDFNTINSKLIKSNQSKITEFRSFYTTNFSQRFLLEEVLGYSLKNKYLKINGDVLDKINSSPDYYIREGNKVILIENKDTYFSAKIKESEDFEEVIKELSEKLFVKSTGKKSAIKQLVNNIIQVLDYKNEFDRDYKPNNLKIYPVIIVHDIFYNTPGLNKIVLKWFNDELVSNNEFIKEPFLKNINPLLIINIDSIIRSAELLRTNNITLFEILNNCIDKMYLNERSNRSKLEKGMYPTFKIIEEQINHRCKTLVQNNKIMDFAFSL